MPGQMVRWREFADPARFERVAAEFILGAAAEAIAERGAFRIVLAGGETPRPIYERVSAADADWDRWHVYFGDERCLPPDDPGRNSVMARSAWLDRVAIPAPQVHGIEAERGPEAGAQRYAAAVSGFGPFDLVLLGLGEDGHTASLFPGGPWEGVTSGNPPDAGAAIPPVVPVFDAPKPPPGRISLSAARLGDARRVLFLVAGAGKRVAVARWQAGDPIPASRIRPLGGVDVFFLDSARG